MGLVTTILKVLFTIAVISFVLAIAHEVYLKNFEPNMPDKPLLELVLRLIKEASGFCYQVWKGALEMITSSESSETTVSHGSSTQSLPPSQSSSSSSSPSSQVSQRECVCDFIGCKIVKCSGDVCTVSQCEKITCRCK